MFAEERRKSIVSILNERESISVNELAKILNVSKTTIRSDLKYLEYKQVINRTHGGATLISSNRNDYKEVSYDLREKTNIESKQEIAKKAYNLIEVNDTIILDSSSTCFELASLLKNSQKEITVLTNGLKTASLLRNNLCITVIVIGGIIRKNSNAIESLLGVEIFNKINIDKVFFSSSGVSPESGFSDFNLYEIELKRKMLQVAKNKYALIDSSKFDLVSSSNFANLNDVTMLITDKKIDSKTFKKYSSHIKIMI